MKSTNFCTHTLVPPDDGPRYARNMWRLTKYTTNKLCIKLVFLYAKKALNLCFQAGFRSNQNNFSSPPPFPYFEKVINQHCDYEPRKKETVPYEKMAIARRNLTQANLYRSRISIVTW